MKKGTQRKTTGTRISFYPDPEIFDKIEFNREYLDERLRELAFLNKGLKIELDFKPEDKEETFQYKGGIKEFIEYLDKNKNPIHRHPLYINKAVNSCVIEVALQFNDSYSENIFSYANNIRTIEGGTHLSGFKSALTRSINQYAKSQKILSPKDPKLMGNDIREGLTAVVSVKLPQPNLRDKRKQDWEIGR